MSDTKSHLSKASSRQYKSAWERRPHTYRLPWVQTGITFLLILALTACRRSASLMSTPLPSVQPVTVQSSMAVNTPTIVTLPVTAAASATSTAASTAEPTSALPLISGPDVTFQDVQLHLPTDLASGVYAQVAPAIVGMGDSYPAHVELTLAEYNSQNQMKPQILIAPVSELSETGTQVVQELKRLLAEQPTTFQIGVGIPIQPPLHAGQLTNAQIQYLTFKNGLGVRFLTQFAQDAWPINNEDLIYVFQGLTNDDQYYVSAFLPVTVPFLPDHVDDPETVPAVDGVSFPKFDSTNFGTEYMSYQEAVQQRLNATSEKEFSPTLGKLDDLIESLQVGMSHESATPCLGAPPTRLRVDLFAYVNPDPPLPNNLRRDAGKDSPLLGEIQPGEAMQILEGPQCVDGWVWWKVHILDTELEGWTAEGDGQNYWLIPCASEKECRP